MARVFDAPRHLVFDAYTKPELLKRWFGPVGWSLVVCEVDLRVGGAYRFVMRRTERERDGDERRLSRDRAARADRRYRVVRRPLVRGSGDRRRRCCIEQGGKTTLTTTVRYDSKAVRDAVLKTPMESGVASSYDRLAQVLAAELAVETRLGA